MSLRPRLRLRLREEDLPPTARTLVRLVGWAGALALVREMPGARLYGIARGTTRAADARFARVSELVGERAARRLFEEFRGDVLEIPTCRGALVAARNRHIRAQFDAGATVEELCAQTGLCRRQIFYLLKIADEPGTEHPAEMSGQMGLF